MLRLTILLSIIPLLTGCLAVGLAAGAGGSYVAAKEYNKAMVKQNRAIEKKAVRKERAIWEAEKRRNVGINNQIESVINKRFISGELTKVISIHTVVNNGIVTLYGNVPSKNVRDRAVGIAKEIKGVKSVISNLVVVEVKIQPTEASKSFFGSTDEN